jgi:hypothetical protein
MKLASALSLAAILATLSLNAMAVDLIMVVPNLMAGNGTRYNFRKTKNVISEINYGHSFYILALPFVFLNEKTNEIQVNEKDLADLNYTAEEIAAYKTDLAKIDQLSSTTQFNSKEEAQNALSALGIGVIAKEQLRIQ